MKNLVEDDLGQKDEQRSFEGFKAEKVD